VACEREADLEIGDTAGLETCATLGICERFLFARQLGDEHFFGFAGPVFFDPAFAEGADAVDAPVGETEFV
jgi:hypothetical protein